jgi:hypothetical protein
MKKLKRLLFALVIGIAVVALCMVSVPAYADIGHYYVHYGKGDWNWVCETVVDCYYSTPSYEILYGSPYNSYADYNAHGGLGVGCNIQELTLLQNSDSMLAYVRATFYPFLGSQWNSEAESWTYPSYTQQPTGGFYNEW